MVKHFQVLEELECYLGLARIDNSQESVLCKHPIVANVQVLSDPVDTLSSYWLDKISSAFGELHVSYAHVDPFPGGKQRQVQRSKNCIFQYFMRRRRIIGGYYICV